MADLKLQKLPDRTPVKLTISVSPDLYQTMSEYAAIYNETYGQTETLADLAPHMLAAFLASDRGFMKTRKQVAQ